MNSPGKSRVGSLLAVLLLATGCAAADVGVSETSSATDGKTAGQPAAITVVIDPRVELVAIAQHLSGYAQRFKGRINEFDHPYLNQIRQHFAAFKDHESLQRLAELGVGGSDPMGIAIQLSDPNDVAFRGPIDRTIARTDKAEAYAGHLRAFAKASNFMAFYEANRATYEAIVDDFKNSIDLPTLAAPVERYCGAGPSHYVVVLAPLLGRTAFGPRITAPDGTQIAYAILPPGGVSEGRLTFGESSALGDHLCHEFGHSFLNPLVDKYWDQLEKYSDLMMKVRYNQAGNYGREWKINVCEHLDRAMTARLVLQRKGEAAYASQMSRDKGRGFVFIEDVCRALATYEQNRDKYPTIDSYFPELVQVFARLHQAAAGNASTS